MAGKITVEKTETADGWNFRVVVSGNGSSTEHEVKLSKSDYKKLTGGKVAPEKLVEKSFEFLLERENKESILREFDISLIGKYFPEYPGEIGKRL